MKLHFLVLLVATSLASVGLTAAVYQAKGWSTVYSGPPESRQRLEEWLKTPKGQEFGCWEVVSVECEGKRR